MKRNAADTERMLRNGEALDRAIIATRRRVIRRHRLLGVPLVVWRDGKVVEISPDEVDIPSDDAPSAAADHGSRGGDSS